MKGRVTYVGCSNRCSFSSLQNRKPGGKRGPPALKSREEDEAADTRDVAEQQPRDDIGHGQIQVIQAGEQSEKWSKRVALHVTFNSFVPCTS